MGSHAATKAMGKAGRNSVVVATRHVRQIERLEVVAQLGEK